MRDLFSPVSTSYLQFGEGAIERIFDNILRWDPELRYFSVVVVRKDPAEDKYANLDELPTESTLRPPLSLPMPKASPPSDMPVGFAFFNHRNAPEVSHFVHSLHHSLHGAAHFYTYAVLVRFQPRYQQQGPGAKQSRLFSHAPHERSVCLLAGSGHRLTTYSAEAAEAYLELCRQVHSVNWQGTKPVGVETLLPYLGLPRGTLDYPYPGNLYLEAPDIESTSWLARVEDGGVGIASNPNRRFDQNDLAQLKEEIYRMYLDWVQQGLEYRVAPGGTFTQRFGRTSAFMVRRYERLRDWMNHALQGEPTLQAPTWVTCAVEPADVYKDLLTADLPDGDEEAFADEPPIPDDRQLYFPNWLQRVIQETTFQLRAYFQLQAPAGMRDAIEREVEHLLVDQGFLCALLTEIGDVDCATIAALAQKSAPKA